MGLRKLKTLKEDKPFEYNGLMCIKGKEILDSGLYTVSATDNEATKLLELDGDTLVDPVIYHAGYSYYAVAVVGPWGMPPLKLEIHWSCNEIHALEKHSHIAERSKMTEDWPDDLNKICLDLALKGWSAQVYQVPARGGEEWQN